MAPISFGTEVPSGSVFWVSGIGNITVTHLEPSSWDYREWRGQSDMYTSGLIANGVDTYAWPSYEYFACYFTMGELGPEMGTITFTFPPQPAGSVYVSTLGLGATTSFGGGTSTTRVDQNGTFLGDFAGDPTAGASLFTSGVHTFTIQNSVTGPGGLNPNWNTQLGVVRIDDAVSSITVYQSVLRGDGIGTNIGFAVPQVTRVKRGSLGKLKARYR